MLHLSPFLSFLPFLLTSTFFTPTHSDHEREQNVRERERESCCMEEEKREENVGSGKFRPVSINGSDRRSSVVR
jgi:hypothetical protein